MDRLKALNLLSLAVGGTDIMETQWQNWKRLKDTFLSHSAGLSSLMGSQSKSGKLNPVVQATQLIKDTSMYGLSRSQYRAQRNTRQLHTVNSVVRAAVEEGKGGQVVTRDRKHLRNNSNRLRHGTGWQEMLSKHHTETNVGEAQSARDEKGSPTVTCKCTTGS